MTNYKPDLLFRSIPTFYLKNLFCKVVCVSLDIWLLNNFVPNCNNDSVVLNQGKSLIYYTFILFVNSILFSSNNTIKNS